MFQEQIFNIGNMSFNSIVENIKKILNLQKQRHHSTSENVRYHSGSYSLMEKSVAVPTGWYRVYERICSNK